MCSLPRSNQRSINGVEGPLVMTRVLFWPEIGGAFKKLMLANTRMQLTGYEVRSDKDLERARPTTDEEAPLLVSPPPLALALVRAHFPHQLPGDLLSFFGWSQNNHPVQTEGLLLSSKPSGTQQITA